MALHTQFRRKLDHLWQRQTAEIHALLKPKRGRPLAFTRT
jgi:predicted ArsR family transcriptional regulator